MKLVLVITTTNQRDRTESSREVTIEAVDANGLYAKAFREYFNALKYCNSVHIQFKDSSHYEPYDVWWKDLDNYASNGGDMW
jgi:hypothetical protein